MNSKILKQISDLADVVSMIRVNPDDFSALTKALKKNGVAFAQKDKTTLIFKDTTVTTRQHHEI